MNDRTTPISLADRRAARREDLTKALSPEQLRRRAMTKLRHNLSSLADDKYEDAKEWLDLIAVTDGPRAALDMYIRLLEFAVPKLSRAEVINETPDEKQTRELTMDELQQMVMAGYEARRQEERTVEGEVEDATITDPGDDAG